jgi:hypothetical protein
VVGEIAATLLKSLPGGAEMVFGPVTRGGIIGTDPETGLKSPNFKANLKALELSIVSLQQQGHLVFNQLLFKQFIDRQRMLWLSKHNRTPNMWHEPLLHEFYAPILETGMVTVGHFIADWRRGKSAKFAHDTLERLGKKTVEHPAGLLVQNIAA